MTLLWAQIPRQARYDEADETHEDHQLNPVFEAAGIKHSPCADQTCERYDDDHGDDFEEAFRRLDEANRTGAHIPIERVDTRVTPLHGFEPTADMHQLRHYMRQQADVPPTAFRSGGKLHLIDGHHRAAAALRNGNQHVDTAIIDLDRKS